MLYNQILPYLPPVLQDILLNPPSLSNPSSFFPIIRAIIPYTQWIIVIVAVYIVWSTVRGIAGYFTRFIRFGLKLGPILALVSWAMSSSGQGGMPELIQAVKEYAGLSTPAAGTRSPGIASLFGDALGGNKRKTDPVSGRTRARKAQAKTPDGTDFLASMLNSATGTGAGAKSADEWQDVVRDYVKNSVAKAAGLDWLLGTDDKNAKDKTRTR